MQLLPDLVTGICNAGLCQKTEPNPKEVATNFSLL
jgi:hypothetical protein